MGTRLTKYGEYSHQSQLLGDIITKQGGIKFLAISDIRPTTPAIANVSISDDNWTAVAIGLTNVLNWRLSERGGQDFYYAFEAAPSAYATAFGWVGEASEITAIYAKRTTAVTLNMELVTWTP